MVVLNIVLSRKNKQPEKNSRMFNWMPLEYLIQKAHSNRAIERNKNKMNFVEKHFHELEKQTNIEETKLLKEANQSLREHSEQSCRSFDNSYCLKSSDKTTIQTFYDRSFFDNYDNKGQALKDDSTLNKRQKKK